ncbi:hypothetical protein LguiA_026505 [Lonicera macranthoides]
MVTARCKESTSFTSHCAYDVFLSSKGVDTRKSFIDYLYDALRDKGLRTFRDDIDNILEIGENISSELHKAIRKSKVSVIALPKKEYASLKQCLDELVKALQHEINPGHVVQPVLYDVDPWDLTAESSCSRNEERQSNNAEETDKIKTKQFGKVTKWKPILQEATGIVVGRVLQNQSYGQELKFIKKFVEDVADELGPTVLGSPPCQFGFGDGGGDIQLICGMGGIGKTTLAKFLYNSNYEKFEGSSFVANIKGTLSQQPNGLIHLQKQLLSDILEKEGIEVSSVDDGITRIKNELRYRKVLIVLDDVEHPYQLDGLLGMQSSFCPGSRIIITSRHKQLLKGYEPCKLYEVGQLNEEESLALFHSHAFGEKHQVEDYEFLSKKLVQKCGGLPLAITVLGSSLYGRGVLEWQMALEELEKAYSDSQDDILERLRKVSYDLLGEEDKALFLDIACFFVGEDKDYVATILEGCGFYAEIGIQNLIYRSLLTVDEDNKVRMHQLLQEMGREIVKQESPEEPGKQSRLWHREDAFHVLSSSSGRTRATEAIEGLALEFHASTDKECRHFSGRHPMSSSSSSSLATKPSVKTAAFSRMRKLRLLSLHNVGLTGGYEEFPKKLRWLCWRGLQEGCTDTLTQVPDIPMDNLVALDMQHCSFTQVWSGTKYIQRLEFLDLSHCHGLTITPDLLGFPKLERLILEDCINLVELHGSVVKSQRLRLLNLNGCTNLVKLPSGLDRLKSLEQLLVSGCSKLETS